MPEVISNTSPLQYLFQTGCLELLPALYGDIAIPAAVAGEIERGTRLGVFLPRIEDLVWLHVRPVKAAGTLPLVTDLGAGEREVLALALETPGHLVLLDDAWARRCARHLGILFTGTLGLLVRAKQRGLLDAVRPVIARLEAAHFYLDPATRHAALRLAGEGE